MASAAKTMMLCAIDVSSSMKHRATAQHEDSKLSMALSLVTSQITQKMIASKTAEFGVITFGDSETDNYLARTLGGYENVNEIVEISKPSAETLAQITSRVQAGPAQGDIINGSIVALDILMRHQEKLKYNRIILLVTDGESEVDPDGVADLEEVVTKMTTHGEKTKTSCMIYAIMIGRSDSAQASVVKKENAKLLRSCCEATGGAFMEGDTLPELLKILSSGTGFGSRPMMSKIVLEVSATLSIPCVHFGLVSKTKLPSLKKEPKTQLAAASAYDMSDPAVVKRDTVYRNPSDPDQEMLLEERVKGYRYGAQYIPMTADDAFKLMSPASIKVIGFMPLAKIPRHHHLDATIVVQGSPLMESAQLAVASLAVALRDLQQACLVRVVKRENSDPYLAMLMAPIDNDGSLLMHRLPCCEDYREFSFPSLLDGPSGLVLESKKSALSNFVDMLTVNKPTSCQLSPVHPAFYVVMEELRNKMVDGFTTLDNPLARVSNSMVPLSSQLSDDVILPCVTAMLDAFELKKSIKVTDKRKTYWSDVNIKTDSDESAVKYTKIDGTAGAAGGAQIDPLAASQAQGLSAAVLSFTTGSVNPVDDFKAAIAAAAALPNATAAISNALAVMSKIITNLVSEGGTNAFYKKAIGCVKALRSTSVCEGEHAFYNAFMQLDVKAVFMTSRHKPFWDLILQENITLISSVDDSASAVSPEEAVQFLTAQPVAAAAPVVEIAAAEEEDLFGNMA